MKVMLIVLTFFILFFDMPHLKLCLYLAKYHNTQRLAIKIFDLEINAWYIEDKKDVFLPLRFFCSLKQQKILIVSISGKDYKKNSKGSLLYLRLSFATEPSLVTLSVVGKKNIIFFRYSYVQQQQQQLDPTTQANMGPGGQGMPPPNSQPPMNNQVSSQVTNVHAS